MAENCPFCNQTDRVFYEGDKVIGFWDRFPVSPGHALLIPKRHISTWFEARKEEQQELLEAIEIARKAIESKFCPEGYNIGFNVGEAAGQTIFHLHVHVIPRYLGDVPDPTGGVRNVIPSKGNYLKPPVGERPAGPEPPHARPLITGDSDDPLLPHILAHLDGAIQADLAIAFVTARGVDLLEDHLYDLLDRGGMLRFLTGDYLSFTDPKALNRLLDISELFPERTNLRVYEAGDGTFHPKSYIFHDGSGGGIAFVGSSNLTLPALSDGLEWNFRTTTSNDGDGFTAAVAGFEELFRHPKTRRLDSKWVEAYRPRHRAAARELEGITPEPEPPLPVPEPHEIQKRALAALGQTRADGNTAGLVVLATGLGKTWLSAFDSDRPEVKRILFVAHREEILAQAMGTYRRIRPEATLGLFTGQEKKPEAAIVFASIQTLSRAMNLRSFAPDEFDYIVVDEFHHASARTYRRVIDHFDPAFLLGLTATPERTDGGDLLALCQENLVFRTDLTEGIESGLLSPFKYFGVPDMVNYENIPWRSNRFDEEALTTAVATEVRAQNALEQYRARAGTRTLAFCCSKRHADFMSSFFANEGLRVAAVHSGENTDPRTSSLERLEKGELDVVFAVDMFNEGVDLPNVDTVMMLRPTESRILWLQQFGRGLRKIAGKDSLTVIDYIGNHRSFLLKPQTLFDLGTGDSHIERVLNLLDRGLAELPPGCEVTYELEAVDIIRQLLRKPRDEDVLRFAYEDFRERYGTRPTATELYHEGYNPRATRVAYGSWLGFVDAMGDLGATEKRLVGTGKTGSFLKVLETTQMTRSFKMLVLQAMLVSNESFPSPISITDMRNRVRQFARRSALIRRDLNIDVDDDNALTKLLENNPIAAWIRGRGTGGTEYFKYEGGVFDATFTVPTQDAEQFAELVREIVDWRLAEYLRRVTFTDTESFTAKVSHSSGKPLLFLPQRDKVPLVPSGWTPVIANGEVFEANFVKMAVNVMRRVGSEENALQEVLRGWFGEDAGAPGTNHQVSFERTEDAWEMTPVEGAQEAKGAVLGKSYTRDEAAALYGFTADGRSWQQGYVRRENHIFLFVTLDKSEMPDEHKYGDRFLSPELFEWKSQNQQARKQPKMQEMRSHRELGISVHLFVRKKGKIEGRAAPFIYCGDVEFVEWEGDKAITVRWRLEEALPRPLVDLFGAGSEKD